MGYASIGYAIPPSPPEPRGGGWYEMFSETFSEATDEIIENVMDDADRWIWRGFGDPYSPDASPICAAELAVEEWKRRKVDLIARGLYEEGD